MIYLSQLSLNPRARQVQAELHDSYQLHRTLAKAFGEGQQAARCLFRVDEDRDGRTVRVLVQSQLRPDWASLTVASDYWASPAQTKELAVRFTSGQRLAFRLRANPTKRLAEKPEGRKLGNRIGLYTEEERLAWLARKATAHGFELCEARIRTDAKETALGKQSQGKTATFSAVLFEGVLVVRDAALFQAAWEGGIGAAKGFGFGLLSLARA